MGNPARQPLLLEPDESIPFDSAFQQCKQQAEQYWQTYPDLRQSIEEKKQAANEVPKAPEVKPPSKLINLNQPTSLFGHWRGKKLKAKIRASEQLIRDNIRALNAAIKPRTQAQNSKCSHQTLEEMREAKANLLSPQLQTWRCLLPILIQQFAEIPDPRQPGKVQHKLTVLLLFGLLLFVFQLKSRREMNRELTSPVLVAHLAAVFPEFESIPHADTITRLLEKIDPKSIESAHIQLIKELIKNKKFKSLLVQGHLPITLDGTQKVVRHGLLQDERWCERVVGNPEAGNKQQYVYVLEANLTFNNGLTVPLMTEYLYRETNELLQAEGKQDSETTAFERLASRLKSYFPRLKLLLLADAMFATQTVMGILHKNHWAFILNLPKQKCTDLAKQLNQQKALAQEIPGQPAYRKRRQEFYWKNDVTYGYDWELTLHLAGCKERYEEVDQKTGEIVEHFVERAWISSLRVSLGQVHELFNLTARQKGFIEDSHNTEKNRGYHYKHAYSYDWHAMQGFHYLLRLGHALNALSEFCQGIKQTVITYGVAATLKQIKETLVNPWLPIEWYQEQRLLTPQLRLQLE